MRFKVTRIPLPGKIFPVESGVTQQIFAYVEYRTQQSLPEESAILLTIGICNPVSSDKRPKSTACNPKTYNGDLGVVTE